MIWELCEVWQFFIASQNILWIQTWELCEVWEFFIASQNILWIQTQTRKNVDMIKWQQTWPSQTNLVTTFKNRVPFKQTKGHCSNCFEKIKRLTKPKGHCRGIAFFYMVSRYFFGSPVDFLYDPRLMALD